MFKKTIATIGLLLATTVAVALPSPASASEPRPAAGALLCNLGVPLNVVSVTVGSTTRIGSGCTGLEVTRNAGFDVLDNSCFVEQIDGFPAQPDRFKAYWEYGINGAYAVIGGCTDLPIGTNSISWTYVQLQVDPPPAPEPSQPAPVTPAQPAPSTPATPSQKYTCADLSYEEAQKYTYLDGDGDGESCDANDTKGTSVGAPGATVDPSVSASPSSTPTPTASSSAHPLRIPTNHATPVVGIDQNLAQPASPVTTKTSAQGLILFIIVVITLLLAICLLALHYLRTARRTI